MSFISVPDINCDVICTQYQYQVHLTSPREIKSSFSLQHSFKTCFEHILLTKQKDQKQVLTTYKFLSLRDIQDLPAFFLNDLNSTLSCDLGIGMQIIDQKNVWSLVKKVEMTSVNGFKNIILNENTEGILVFIEVNFCWYIVVSIAIKHFQ